MYNDRVLRKLLVLNQHAWAAGDYEEIQLPLSAQCRAKTGITSWFDRDKHVKLWVVEQRMKFVLAAAEQFDKLLNGPQRRQVDESIRAIAAIGCVE